MTRSHPGDAAISGLAGSAGLSPTRPRTLRTLLLLAVTASLATLLLGPLAPAASMPLTSASDATLWFDQASPAIVAITVLRMVALGICGYLTLALALTLAVDLFDRACGRTGRSHAAIARLLPALLRRFIMGTAQVGLVAVTALPAAASPAATPPGDAYQPATATMTYDGSGRPETPPPPTATATMTSLGPTSTVPPTHIPPTPVPPTPVATATMTRLGPGPTTTTPSTTTPSTTTPSTTTPSTTTPSTTIAPETAPTQLAPVPTPPEAPAPAAPDDQETWVVSAGDTFWSIAEESLTDWRGSFPPQNEVIRYWRQLIAANQRLLAAPGNPDLLVPGQALVLPSPG